MAKTKKKSELRTITYEYKISPNYAVYSIAGGHGGFNAKGEIILNLFSERAAVPKKETYEIDKDGKASSLPVKVEKKDSYIRDVLFGISLNHQEARAIADWLNNKANELEKAIKLNLDKAEHTENKDE